MLFPWFYAKALRELSTGDFLKIEKDFRARDGFADYCCDRSREERGLAVPIARNYNFTAIGWR